MRNRDKALLIWTIMGMIELGYIPHTKLGFICKDPSISHPYRGDTISTVLMLFGNYFVPYLAIFLVESLREKSFKRVCLGTVWHFYQECVIGGSLVLLLTEIFKVLVGEPRPHFLDSCEPDAGFHCVPGTLVLDYNCTNERLSFAFRNDVTRSFPSGHTSLSVFVGLFLSYLVQTRIPAVSVTKLTKPFLVAVWLTWSAVVSFSRITDRRHHWWDVAGGALIGICGALFSLIILNNKEKRKIKLVRTNTSTTTLLDVKNKDATSVII